jgi:hypothetical protein
MKGRAVWMFSVMSVRRMVPKKKKARLGCGSAARPREDGTEASKTQRGKKLHPIFLSPPPPSQSI